MLDSQWVQELLAPNLEEPKDDEARETQIDPRTQLFFPKHSETFFFRSYIIILFYPF